MDGVVDLDQLKTALEALPTAKLVVGTSGEVLYGNANALSLFDYGADDFARLHVEDLIPEGYRENHQRLLKESVGNPRQRARTLETDLAARRRDGSEFMVEIGLNPLDTDAGRVVIVSVNDVTERFRTKERYQRAILQSPVGILIVSAAGEIIVSNHVMNAMFGYGEGELTGCPVEQLLPANIRDHHVGLREDYTKMPAARQMGEGRELYGLDKSGSRFPVEIALNPLQLTTGTEIIVQVVDISNRKKLEREKRAFDEKLQQIQKLESLGVMAGGVAHDFNNILTGIVGYAELALMEIMPGSPQYRYLENILQASQKAASLCDQMLAYSGGGKFVFKQIDTNELIMSSTTLFNASISKHVRVDFSLAENLPAIVGDTIQIQQVIMNLVVNASEAIGNKGGQILISSGLTDYDPRYMSPGIPNEEDIEAGMYVYISVSDDGPGMDAATQKRIFEPFYTTKFTGRGLGLAAVLGILRNHKGTVRIYSEPGQGTNFKIMLPVPDTEGLEQFEAEIEAIEGRGTVLIIDDEQVVHDVAGETLAKIGYKVLHAYDGREGLQVFQNREGSINLILLDITMPLMTGDEVFQRVRLINDSVKIIITSGYAEEMVMQKFQDLDVAAFLPKPISPGRLMHLMKEVITTD